MEIGTVKFIDIEDKMRTAYLDYAMSVITARALPDVRDGLKPVQRRILYAMNDMGLQHDKPYKKSARIVGEVLGKYHPHGDAAVYDAMVRLAQDFSMRYVLVDGQGNFGSVDGDNAAAMRYTEARLTALAEEMLADIDKETVDFTSNFDGSLQEPLVLPTRLPNLLVNGTAGIAVGMATNIPPHNLGEVCDAIAYLIEHYRKIDDVTVDELMRFIKGPDFPTGGSIMGLEGIRSAYATGKGRIVIRAKAHIEEIAGGRYRIIVTEIPYQVNKANLVERIADLVRNHRIETISDLRDESDRQGTRVVIELKRGAEPRTTLNQLLKYTQMQTTFGVNMLALVDGEPRMLSLRRALQLFIEHRREVITRRSEFELERAKQRAHILEGLKIALDHLDEVISTIRASRTAETALDNLRRKFKLTEIQARAILDMQLRRLAGLERRKIEEEYREVTQRIRDLQALLRSPTKILELIKAEMQELKTKYGDTRRTRVAEEEVTFTPQDLVPKEDVLIAITQHGYIKRMAADAYGRRGRSARAIITRDTDAVQYLFAANTLDSILFFTDKGRVFQEKAHQIPDIARQDRGIPVSNIVALESGEKVTAAVAVPDFEQAEYLTMVTRQGRIKRTVISEFSAVRPSGIAAISLSEGDELGWVSLTHGDQEIVLVTERGQAIRFSEEEVRPMGRAAGGVGAITLGEGDSVTSMDVIRPEGELLLITAKGYGKRTPLKEYPKQGRNGRGVVTLASKYLEKTGPVTAARVVDPDGEVMIISAQGVVLRCLVKDFPRASRASRGNIVMKLKGNDTAVSIAKLGNAEADKTPGELPADERSSSRARGKTGKKGSVALRAAAENHDDSLEGREKQLPRNIDDTE